MKKNLLGASICAIVSLISHPSYSQDISAKIINGSSAPHIEWDFMAAIVEKGIPASKGQFCGGSIISAKHILTAAHCLENTTADQIQVYVGTSDLNKEGTEGLRLNVSKVMSHSQYGYYSFNGDLRNDIAILELETALSNNFASTVTLAGQNTRTNTVDGTPLEVAGWGSTIPDSNSAKRSPELLEVELPLTSQATCANTFSGVSNTTNAQRFCAGDGVSQKDSCFGDSGGPIVIKDTRQQLGIVSYGKPGVCGEMGVYANISYFEPWIAAHTSGLSYNSYEDLGFTTQSTLNNKLTFTNNSDSQLTLTTVTTGSHGGLNITNTNNQCLGRTLNIGASCDIDFSLNVVSLNSGIIYANINANKNGVTIPLKLSRRITPVKAAAADVVAQIPLSGVSVYQDDNPWVYTNGELSSSPNGGLYSYSTLTVAGLNQGFIAFDLDVSPSSNDIAFVEINGTAVESISTTHSATKALALPRNTNSVSISYRKGSSSSTGKTSVKNWRLISQSEYIALSEGSSSTTNTNSGAKSGGGGAFGYISLLLLGVVLLLQRRK